MCDARQYGDQMVCGPCGLQWDMNDSEPPECLPEPRRITAGREGLDKIHKQNPDLWPPESD